MKLLKIVALCLVVFTACKENKPANKAVISIEEKPTEIVAVKSDTTNMVYFEGGTVLIGSDTSEENEKPAFQMEIAPFYIDKNLVTVDEFRNFIKNTGYKTEADNFGDSGVFLFETNNWTLLKGANWEYPLGPDKEKAIGNHPVTHVSWNDAKAYATWVGKRLPTEFEWEFAAKGGKNNTNKYAWGNELIVNGKYMANVWQGEITSKEVLDGYLYTSPVGIFGETEQGLTDMGGNVWQWCENSFNVYPVKNVFAAQDSKIRTTRGGSFMFDQANDRSFTTTFRGQNSVETSLFNMGFRCAK